MNYLSADSISKASFDGWLFKNITFGLEKGQKTALVGVNGCGKSTLLRILAGELQADEGQIATAKNIKVGFLEQDPEFPAGRTVKEVLFTSEHPALQAIGQYEQALLNPSDKTMLSNAMEAMEAAGGWEYEQKVKEVISRMGIPSPEQEVSSLSGGQKKRVALAKLLLLEPDVFLLDEPTNHLDLPAIEWLQNFLSTANTSLIMVTHDRYFLDAVTNDIIEMDKSTIFRYTGNYSYFLEKKLERETIEAVSAEKAKNLLRKELDWMRRQPKARTTKAKYREDAFYELQDKVSEKGENRTLDFQYSGSRQGKKVIEIENITKSFGSKTILKPFSYKFGRAEKIGVIGGNGTGKSTFLNIITKNLKPDSGELLYGETTKIGYFRQDSPDFPPGERVLDIVRKHVEVMKLDDGREITASKMLEMFGFTALKQYGPASKLSGGEKKRLQLLIILLQNPNLLILDEPTNDLDLETLNVLEDFLYGFAGTLLVVTHDRYFLDRLADHLLVFEGNGEIRDFPGNYTDYRLSLEEDKNKSAAKIAEPSKVEKESKPKNDTSKKLSYKEKRELDELELDIKTLEKEKNDLIQKMNQSDGSHEALNQLATKFSALNNELDEKTFRWLELAEKL